MILKIIKTKIIIASIFAFNTKHCHGQYKYSNFNKIGTFVNQDNQSNIEDDNIIISLIQKAQHSIKIMSHSISSPKVAKSLIKAKSRNVHISIVVDKNISGEELKIIETLEQNKIKVIKSTKVKRGSKFGIFDKDQVSIGKCNITEKQNLKRLMCGVFAEPKIVSKYTTYFKEAFKTDSLKQN